MRMIRKQGDLGCRIFTLWSFRKVTRISLARMRYLKMILVSREKCQPFCHLSRSWEWEISRWEELSQNYPLTSRPWLFSNTRLASMDRRIKRQIWITSSIWSLERLLFSLLQKWTRRDILCINKQIATWRKFSKKILAPQRHLESSSTCHPSNRSSRISKGENITAIW